MATQILCCGDSLTAGYYGPFDHYAPYSEALSKRLRVPADEIGRCGWRADEMVVNMGNQMCIDVFHRYGPGLAVQLAAKRYDVCIIMAGTNDLGANRPAESIVNDLKALHEYCLSKGLRTVALPIPESRLWAVHQGQAPQLDTRTQVNRLLREWAATMDAVVFVDMARHVPYSDVDGNWAPDGVHMSRQGYATFGDKYCPCFSLAASLSSSLAFALCVSSASHSNLTVSRTFTHSSLSRCVFMCVCVCVCVCPNFPSSSGPGAVNHSCFALLQASG